MDSDFEEVDDGRAFSFGMPVQCNFCKYAEFGLECAAFPGGIPRDIIHAFADHRLPYPGDRGIRFEPKDEEAANIMIRVYGEVPGSVTGPIRERAKAVYDEFGEPSSGWDALQEQIADQDR